MPDADEALDVLQVPDGVGRAGTPVALHRHRADVAGTLGQAQVRNFFLRLTDHLQYNNDVITIS